VRFKFVIASWNAAPWLERCLESVHTQGVQNFDACVVIDGSTDRSAEIVSNYIEDKPNFQMIVNEEKGCTLKSQRQAIEALNCEDDDVIVWLDGDDCLANADVLAKLTNRYRKEDLFVTYGSYIPVPANRGCSPATTYPVECLKTRDFRNARKWGFHFNHLRTMRYHLYSKIPLEYLSWDDGSWFTVGGDAAEMICAMEMAGPDRILFIEDVLVHYTSDNSNSDWRIASPEIRRTHNRIMSMPKLRML